MLRGGIIFDVDETLVYYEGYDHKKWFEEWVKPELERHGIKLDYELYSKTARLELPQDLREETRHRPNRAVENH